MDGYHGKILEVDLTSGKTDVMEPDAPVRRSRESGANRVWAATWRLRCARPDTTI